jgi:hypothetical protein
LAVKDEVDLPQVMTRHFLDRVIAAFEFDRGRAVNQGLLAHAY